MKRINGKIIVITESLTFNDWTNVYTLVCGNRSVMFSRAEWINIKSDAGKYYISEKEMDIINEHFKKKN